MREEKKGVEALTNGKREGRWIYICKGERMKMDIYIDLDWWFCCVGGGGGEWL